MFFSTVQKLELHGDCSILQKLLRLPQQSSHQCDQSSTQSCADSVLTDERLQALVECTSTHDGVSKEEFAPTKTQFFNSRIQWRDFHPEITHVADEQICLEEQCEKVLSGKMRTTTYLDSEQELVMPEIGYQLLHNYADQMLGAL
ncbi:uncharacterized protein LOC129871956 [Solanum dulcamara]|uniref:uncharacterized protein LOC129871956 n=1 Tax=Solanum dulcamara TaxID=45834 RepID=UPI002485B65F|nr:uncharacterized protein LOC129871956 [Solanum dulcamara]